MELDNDQAQPVPPAPTVVPDDDEFSTDDIKFEAPERPQIQLSRRSEALRCGYTAT